MIANLSMQQHIGPAESWAHGGCTSDGGPGWAALLFRRHGAGQWRWTTVPRCLYSQLRTPPGVSIRWPTAFDCYLAVGALPRIPVHFEPARDSRTADTIFSCRLSPYAGAQFQCPCAFAMIPAMLVRQAVFASIPPNTRPIFPPPNLSTCFRTM